MKGFKTYQKELFKRNQISFCTENFKSNLTIKPININNIPMYEFKDSSKMFTQDIQLYLNSKIISTKYSDKNNLKINTKVDLLHYFKIIFQSRLTIINYKLMQNLLQRDLGSSLLSIAIFLGWLGLFFVFLRVLTISIKKILEALFRKS